MKVEINVPSRMRAGAMETWSILPSANYWIHTDEVEAYDVAHPGINIRVLPDSTKGNVAKVRNQILKEWPPDVDVSVQIDDDVFSIGYWEAKGVMALRSESEILDMILRYSTIADELGVFLWGINVNRDKQVYREYTPFSTLSYVSASFSCFMRGNDILYDERFSLKEDYDMTVAQVLKYRKVLRVNKYFYVKKGAEQKGGCAAYRNINREMDQIKKLQKKWGKKIIKVDDGKSRSHNTDKKRSFDINPIVKIPIRGV